MTAVPESCYEFGPFQLDPLRRVLWRDSKPVPITSMVFDTLLLLIENQGTVLTKDELIKSLWPDKIVEEAGLTQNIMTVVLSLGASIVGIAVLLHYLPKTHLFSRTGLVSTTVLQNSVTPPETDELGYPKSSSLLEKSGTAVTALRPAGKVEIDGQTLDVVTEGEFIDAGMLVEVSYVEGNRIVVRPRV